MPRILEITDSGRISFVDGAGAEIAFVDENTISLAAGGSLDLSDGTNTFSWTVPTGMVADVSLAPPNADGSAEQVIRTDGAGALSFVNNTVRLRDGGGNIFEFTTPGSMVGNVSIELPSADGSNEQVMRTNGAGVLTFIENTVRLSDGANLFSFTTPGSMVGNVSLELPSADGSAEQVLRSNGSGVLSFVNNTVRLRDGTGNIFEFTTPGSMAGNVSLELPSADGTAGQFLKTSGAGVLSWDDPVSEVTGGGTANTVPRWTTTSALGDSQIQDDGTSTGVNRAPLTNAALVVDGNGFSQGINVQPSTESAGTPASIFAITNNANQALYCRRSAGTGTVVVIQSQAAGAGDCLLLDLDNNNDALQIEVANANARAININANASPTLNPIETNVGGGTPAHLSTSGVWTDASCFRRLKTDFEDIDVLHYMKQLLKCKLQKHRPKHLPHGTKKLHVYQDDLVRRFGLVEAGIRPGEIATVALACIQGLVAILTENKVLPKKAFT